MPSSSGVKAREFVTGLVFPESPRWRDGHLWLSDLHAHRVLTVDERGSAGVVAELDDQPSGIGFTGVGTPIVVAMRSRRLLLLGGRIPQVHADLSSIPGSRLNDMVADERGAAYVGNYVVDGAQRFAVADGDPWPDSLIRIEPDGSYRVVADQLFSPNGMVISADGKTLVVAQTYGRVLLSFAIGEDGGLSSRKVFADLGHRHPDGICLDAEGAVWVACPREQEFVRVFPGGRIADRIAFPESTWAVACTLGGPRRQTLFLACAETTLENQLSCTSFEADLESRAKGFVLACDVDVAGVGLP